MKYFSSIRILVAKSWMRESRAFGAGRGKYRKGLGYSTNSLHNGSAMIQTKKEANAFVMIECLYWGNLLVQRFHSL